MKKNMYFKPTIICKEYLILDMIEKNPNITQRAICKEIGIAVSMVNDYLEQYEKKEYISRNHHTSKKVDYIITKKGIDRKKILNLGYLKDAQRLYNIAKENIEMFLKKISDKGFKNILLYGAGEVAEMILSVLNDKNELFVLSIIDDNPEKQGKTLSGKKIVSINNISNYHYDIILISTYTNVVEMYNKLINIKIDSRKIIMFF